MSQRRSKSTAAIGYICVSVGAFFYASQGVLSKFCTDGDISVIQTMTGSCVAQVFLSGSAAMTFLGGFGDLGRQDVKSLVVQGLCNTSAVLLWFGSYTYLDVGDASALAYSYPIFLPILALVILKETTPWFTWLSTAASFGGMLLIARPAAIFGDQATSEAVGLAALPGGEDAHMKGIILALGSAISFAFFVCAARKLGESVHAVVSCGGMALTGILLVCPCAWAATGFEGPLFPVTPGQWLWTLPVGAAGFLATVFATAGYQRAPAAQAAVLSLLDVVFSFIAQPVVFGQPLDPMSVTGAAVILSGCAAQTILAAILEKKEPDSPILHKRARAASGVVIAKVTGTYMEREELQTRSPQSAEPLLRSEL